MLAFVVQFRLARETPPPHWTARVANIFLDTASVRPSRQHFRSCGTKLQLERQPAIRPMIVGREVANMPIFTRDGGWWDRAVSARE